ncbi:hypothetical protein MLP_23900 [Microlunatus phosphovorus NM-1]|uniref:Uncharacterized protein n=1 Tax=Microlunatus phosphovorus (strain ATCC 700054 / DSM 10555 / JCM 9379 / NBRC 101784 / NCIMB 13414 / VKM Ac-1990 / NM-1) TaxID=1032480 RepID=F5XFJ7_MICPN|nr:hypothetical protein MLP_23900 [Microlunatus phosphovorus NM-1]
MAYGLRRRATNDRRPRVTAYLSRRRATDQRRSSVFWLCQVGSLIEKEVRHLKPAI